MKANVSGMGNSELYQTYHIESIEQETEGRRVASHLDDRVNDCRPEIPPDQRQLLPKLVNNDTEDDVNMTEPSIDSNGYIACHNHEADKTERCNTVVVNQPDERDVELDANGRQQREKTKPQISVENDVTDVRQIHLTNGTSQSAEQDEDESMTTLSKLHVASTTGNGFAERVCPRHEKQVWHETGCIRVGGGSGWIHGEQELVADSVY